jgi:ankyrin repeat protein
LEIMIYILCFQGMTPLHLAVQFGHDEVRDLLVHYGNYF